MTAEDNGDVNLHTAITTWSGFIYQDKVAFHHVLFLFNNSNDCDEYKLQLDSLEFKVDQ